MNSWIKCPKCGGDVYAPTFSGICTRCNLTVFPSGQAYPAPQTANYNYPCDMMRGPCACGGWHDEQDQIDKAMAQGKAVSEGESHV